MRNICVKFLLSRKGTPYKDYLDAAILKMIEGGSLYKFKVGMLILERKCIPVYFR